MICLMMKKSENPHGKTHVTLPHQAADGLQMRSLVAEDQRRVRLRVAYAGNPIGMQQR